MSQHLIAVASISLLAIACSSAPVLDAGRARAEVIFSRALADDEAMATLRELCTAAPHRVSGTAGAAAAVSWTLQKMRSLGLVNVRAEPCMVPHWERGAETAEVVGVQPVPLRVCALGGSIATPEGGIEAEIVEVRSFEQLAAMGDKAKGKIVFFNRPMPRALRSTGQAYGQAVPQRTNGAVEAGKVGAIGALVRSMTTQIDEYPHTGVTIYADGVTKVPAAAVSTVDAEMLASRLKQGPVRVHLVLGCQTLPDVESANVVGELRGSELPDEIVVIGGHLDAWDLGQGAHDDGAGIAHCLEAMRLLQVCGVQPRRTIRCVAFMNEENGTRGAMAYEAAHANDKHVAAIETDSGGLSPQGFGCSLTGAAAAKVRAAFAPMSDYGVGAFVEGGGGGADIGPLGKHGVALYGLIVVGHRYFDYHHSALDVPAAVNSRELAMGAATVAFAASVLADL